MTWRQLIGAIVVFVLVFVALTWATLPLRSDRREAAREKVEDLKFEYAFKKMRAMDLEVYREQMREAERLHDALRVQLPDKADRTFVGVRSAAKARGLRLDVLAAAKDDWRREFYVQAPARIVVTGRYHQVGAFLADVGRLPSSTRIEPFVIERSSQPGMVTLKGVVLAYGHVSNEELAAQRMAGKP